MGLPDGAIRTASYVAFEERRPPSRLMRANSAGRKTMKRQDRETPSAELEGRTLRDLAILIAGIGIGSGVALLLAPRSGEEVRHAIGRGYRKTIENIGRQTENLRDRAEDFLEDANELVERGSRLLRFRRGRDAERRVG
jgi:hypothetical protein